MGTTASANDDIAAIAGDATRDRIFQAAERLFAERGFAAVSVRDITTEAGVNLAAVNYHFGSRDALLFDIFKRRSTELNRTRARLLHEAEDRHAGRPPLRDILHALVAPPMRWSDPASERFQALQVLIRARSEGSGEVLETLRGDVTHLTLFADALARACPALAPPQLYWRLHFVLGLIHQNRDTEMQRLRAFSHGAAGHEPIEAQIELMVDFAEAGFSR